MTASLGVTVLVVSYDSRADLERLLPTIPGGAEVVVVDNHGADGVAPWLADHHPDVRVVASGANLGYAGGNNLGLRHARRDWVLVLNPDTQLGPGAVERLLATARAHPDALVTPKLLDPEGRVYACGLDLHYTGLAMRRGAGAAAERTSGVSTVPLISGTAFLARRALLEELGGFDEAYFMYMEDVELSLRAGARGSEVLCDADAVVTHHAETSVSAPKMYFLERNRLFMMLATPTAATRRRLLPGLILTELVAWGYAAWRGLRFVAAKARGYRWLWAHRQELRARRAAFQANRTRDDGFWLAAAGWRLPADLLLPGRGMGRLVDAVTAPLYRLVRPRG